MLSNVTINPQYSKVVKELILRSWRSNGEMKANDSDDEMNETGLRRGWGSQTLGPNGVLGGAVRYAHSHTHVEISRSG